MSSFLWTCFLAASLPLLCAASVSAPNLPVPNGKFLTWKRTHPSSVLMTGNFLAHEAQACEYARPSCAADVLTACAIRSETPAGCVLLPAGNTSVQAGRTELAGAAWGEALATVCGAVAFEVAFGFLGLAPVVLLGALPTRAAARAACSALFNFAVLATLAAITRCKRSGSVAHSSSLGLWRR
jgi:hypothetical protein